jgi:hypothetical protein
LPVELADAREQLVERDVAAVVRDPARLALLGCADVHELDVAQLVELVGCHLPGHGLDRRLRGQCG